MPEKLYHKINVQIIIALLILFALAGVAVSTLNLYNLRNIYVKSFTDRVLISNQLIASLIDGDDIKYYADLMRSQDEGFKARQYQFQLDREELYALQQDGAPESRQAPVIARMEAFHHDMNVFKTEKYWGIIADLQKLKEGSRAKYVYVFTDTGVTDADGTMLYTYLFDAEDAYVYDRPDSDGLGTVAYSVDEEAVVAEIYRTKKQMDAVLYYNEEPYGELYYAYAPVLDSEGNIIALLGTDLELSGMHSEIARSMLLFSAVFLAFVILIILTIYIFLRYAVTRPLGALTATAQRLARGDIYATVPPVALNQRSEFGVLAHVTKDMIGVYQSMILNRAILDSNPYTCIIFDEEYNIIDCNPKTLEVYRFNSLDELNAGYRGFFATAIPDRQPDGRKSIAFSERLKTAFAEGYCEYDTYLHLFGKLTPFNNIMKLIEYKSKPAVVVYQFNLTAQKEIQQTLEYRGRLLQAASDISDLLLTAETESFEITLYKAFDVLGRVASVDRIYIWKNTTDEEGRLYMTQLYEWSPDADPQQGNEFTVGIPYDEVMPSWKDSIFKGQCLNSIVKNMGKEEQDQLLPQGIVSLLIAPIFIQNKFWGFIGFDDCHNERVFTKTEENILRTCGYMVMSFSDTVQNEIAMNLMAAKEEAVSNARTKSNFLASMSHEIRTPMNAILGMTELILHEKTTETVLNYAADIKNACRGLLALINDILDISKIESGKLEIVTVRYQISSLLMDVISIIKLRSDKKGIALIANIDPKLPSNLMGDEIRIKQILINLLNNAVKFTHEGYVKLSVRGKTENGRMYLECSVSDTGIGIKAEDKEKLFESFQQVDTRKNRNIEGSGLGLSITKQIVEMMEGSITVESEYGVGSTFTATIPQPVADSNPMAMLKNPEKNSVLVYENRSAYLDSIIYALESLDCRYSKCSNQSELHELLNEINYNYIFVSSLYANKTQILASEKQPNAIVIALNGDGSMPLESGILSISMPVHSLQIANILNDEYEDLKRRSSGSKTVTDMAAPDAKVLVVDDNIVNLKVAVGLLKTYKIQADTAVSGRRAIEMVKQTAYDVVFMDHMMPEMDGIDTTVTIRGLEGRRFRELPIIALTANAISGAREMFKAEGLNDYLAKPIEMSKLNAILVKWIPEEKQQVKIGGADTNTAADLEISGLNVQSGIEHSGGTLENYIDILEAYAADGEKRLKEIAECYKAGDLKMLTIYVHALKSASANIGADEISYTASALEFAGKNEDTAYIDKHIKTFIDELSIVLSNIRAYLNSREKGQIQSAKSADPDILQKALVKISESLENVNIEEIEAELKELLSYNWAEDIASLLGKMKDCVGFFDYDGIESTLEELKTSVTL